MKLIIAALTLLAIGATLAAPVAAEGTRTLQIAPFMAETPAGDGLALWARDVAGGDWAALKFPIADFRFLWGYEYQATVEAADGGALKLTGEPQRSRIPAGSGFTLLLSTRAIALRDNGGSIHARKTFTLGEDIAARDLRSALRSAPRLRFQFAFGAAPGAPLVLSGWSQPIEGVLWRLTSLGGKAPLPGSQVTAGFRDGRAAGNATVNHFMGGYTLSGARLRFSDDMVTTKMMGEPEEMAQEMAFMNALDKVARATIGQSALILADAKGRTLMTFADSLPPKLEGVQWNLVSIGDRKVLPGVPPDILLRDGRLASSGGINQIFGDYALDGRALTFSLVGSTKMAGPPERMMQESDFLQALAQVRAWRMDSNCLDLLDAAGAAVLTFEPAP